MSFFKKLNKVSNTLSTVSSVTNALRSADPIGGLAQTALQKAQIGQNNLAEINKISGFRKSSLGGLFNKIPLNSNNIDFTGGTFGFPNAGSFDNILSQAGELSGLIDSPIRLARRGATEIFSANGGQFDVLREQVEQLSQLSAFEEFIDTDFSPPAIAGGDFSKKGKSKSRIENPLRNFSSYNYKFTLGVLSAQEFNNPKIVREQGGFKNYVIRSTGGNLDKRYQVDDEFNSSDPGHAEYFIENVNYEAIVAPNPATGVTMGTTFSFQVTEPYSMGNFTEALVGAAIEAGYKSYYTAPFCLRVDFSGWGEEEVALELKPVFLPLKIINMDMRVDGQGSTYDIQAVPYNELGLSDNVNKLMTPASTVGRFAHEMLQSGQYSLTSIMNRRIEKLENSNVVPGYDRFLICFPKKRTSIIDYLSKGLQKPEDKDALQQIAEEKGESTSDNAAGLGAINNQQKVTDATTLKNSSGMFETLLAFCEDEGEMNEIGKSIIVDNPTEGGNQKFSSNNGAYDEVVDGPNKSAATMQHANVGRLQPFEQGAKVTKSIEKVILRTEYAKENATKESDEKGIKRWFRIETNVYMDDTTKTEETIGRPAMIFVYCVHPYEVDEAKTLAGNQVAKNTAGLKKSAAKEYNYIYTGTNEDVLDVQIEFNTAFTKTALAGYGNNSGGSQAQAAHQSVISNDEPQAAGSTDNVESGGTQNPADDPYSSGGGEATAEIVENPDNADNTGDHSVDIRRQIAENFHNGIINQISDMISVEMSIMGDPFFLPQEIGNYAVEPTGPSPNATADGTMTYTKGEVFVVLNFVTPFDRTTGALMEMPQIAPQFSGLYSVWKVINEWSNGRYTQTLSMLRRPKQTMEPTTGNTGIMTVDETKALKQKLPDASKVTPEQRRLLNGTSDQLKPNEVQKAVNMADNLLAQAKNSGASVGRTIAQQANISDVQNAFSTLTSTGTNAASLVASTTANQAAKLFGSKPEDFVPSKANSAAGFSFANDLAGAVNNALVQAVPSFGAVSVDLASAEGRLGVLAANLEQNLNGQLDTGLLPVIEDKTADFKKNAGSFQTAAIDLAPASITPEQTSQLRTIAERNAQRARGIIT